MLPSKLRVSKTEFKFLGRGQSYHSTLVSLFAYKKTDHSPSQFSFSCSKKVSKSAVSRNKLRRQGYASVEKKLNLITSGYYFVFVFKKEAFGTTYNDIDLCITELLRKANALL